MTGYAPQDENEQRHWGMNKGLDFISDPANKITEDPFFIQKVAAYDVLEFLPTKAATGFTRYLV